MKRPQTSINTGLAAIFTLFYLQKSRFCPVVKVSTPFPLFRIFYNTIIFTGGLMKLFRSLTLLLAAVCFCLTGCGLGTSKDSELTKVTLNEVTHSIFYAPQYVAIEKGYFEEEGISGVLQ